MLGIESAGRNVLLRACGRLGVRGWDARVDCLVADGPSLKLLTLCRARLSGEFSLESLCCLVLRVVRRDTHVCGCVVLDGSCGHLALLSAPSPGLFGRLLGCLNDRRQPGRVCGGLIRPSASKHQSESCALNRKRFDYPHVAKLSADRIERSRWCSGRMRGARLVQIHAAVRTEIYLRTRPPTESQRHCDRSAQVCAASGTFNGPIERKNCAHKDEHTHRGQGGTDFVPRFIVPQEGAQRKNKPSESTHREKPSDSTLNVGANCVVHALPW